jgi:hypothetical protein
LPVQLEGKTTFAAYYARTGELFSDPSWNYCPVIEAELIPLEGQAISLRTVEGGNCAGREIVWEGKISPGKQLKVTMPEEYIPVVNEHTGCSPNGTFSVYHGYFDG